jgi:hypothetical protein
MTFHRELWQGILDVALMTGVLLVAIGYAQGSETPPASSNEAQQIGKILSVRKTLRNPYFFSRYPRIHYYQLYFAIRVSEGKRRLDSSPIQ